MNCIGVNGIEGAAFLGADAIALEGEYFTNIFQVQVLYLGGRNCASGLTC